jgi:hypothetical protein
MLLASICNPLINLAKEVKSMDCAFASARYSLRFQTRPADLLCCAPVAGVMVIAARAPVNLLDRLCRSQYA